MARCAIWHSNDVCSPLYLSPAHYDKDGTIKSGYVVNGDWNFEVRGSECLAKAGNHIVNRWPKPEKFLEVKIPRGQFMNNSYDYNKVIKWAESRKGVLCPE